MGARGICLAVITIGALAIGGPAQAGGGHWAFGGVPLDSEPVFVAGESVHAAVSLFMEGVKRNGEKDVFWAGPQHGPFYGYIVERGGPDWGPYPPPLPHDALYVGDVVFHETDDPRRMDVTLDFVMPDLEPGYYSLIHCNDPCTRQIGDTMSTAITIVQDEGQAFLANRVDRLDTGLMNVRLRSANRIRGLEGLAERLTRRVDAMGTEISTLQRELRLASAPAPEAAPSPFVPLAVGAGAIVLIAVLLRSRLVRPRDIPEVVLGP